MNKKWLKLIEKAKKHNQIIVIGQKSCVEQLLYFIKKAEIKHPTMEGYLRINQAFKWEIKPPYPDPKYVIFFFVFSFCDYLWFTLLWDKLVYPCTFFWNVSLSSIKWTKLLIYSEDMMLWMYILYIICIIYIQFHYIMVRYYW